MARRGECRCGALLTFRKTRLGYKCVCPSCRAVVRLRVRKKSGAARQRARLRTEMIAQSNKPAALPPPPPPTLSLPDVELVFADVTSSPPPVLGPGRPAMTTPTTRLIDLRWLAAASIAALLLILGVVLLVR